MNWCHRFSETVVAVLILMVLVLVANTNVSDAYGGVCTIGNVKGAPPSVEAWGKKFGELLATQQPGSKLEVLQVANGAEALTALQAGSVEIAIIPIRTVGATMEVLSIPGWAAPGRQEALVQMLRDAAPSAPVVPVWIEWQRVAVAGQLRAVRQPSELKGRSLYVKGTGDELLVRTVGGNVEAWPSEGDLGEVMTRKRVDWAIGSVEELAADKSVGQGWQLAIGRDQGPSARGFIFVIGRGVWERTSANDKRKLSDLAKAAAVEFKRTQVAALDGLTARGVVVAQFDDASETTWLEAWEKAWRDSGVAEGHVKAIRGLLGRRLPTAILTDRRWESSEGP